jgi:anti-sigma-K factor RskA
VNRPLPPSMQDDAALRQLHAQALDTLSPTTLARLRSARHAGPSAKRHTPSWWMATACSAVVALALGYSFLLGDTTAPPAPVVASAADDGSDVLDENPDLYVWLGSTDLAME